MNTLKMKTTVLSIVLSSLTIVALASGPTNSPKSNTAHNYVIMKHGKVYEVNHGRKTMVKKDITLTNETTVHPNGTVDAGSGQNFKLKEGQYMTMDGKIRKLKNMPKKKSTH